MAGCLQEDHFLCRLNPLTVLLTCQLCVKSVESFSCCQKELSHEKTSDDRRKLLSCSSCRPSTVWLGFIFYSCSPYLEVVKEAASVILENV